MTLPDPLESDWLYGGLQQSVSTPRNTGEDDGDWVARHEATVRALKQALPPDAGSETQNYVYP